MLKVLVAIGNWFSRLKKRTIQRNHMFVVGSVYHYKLWQPDKGPSKGYSFVVETKTYLLANAKKEHSHSTIAALMIPLELMKEPPKFFVSREEYDRDLKAWDAGSYTLEDISMLEHHYQKTDRKELH